MLGEELRSEKQDITSDVKMITNLQNIKHVLKKNFKDGEILSFLSDFDFTDNLISSHLSQLESTKPSKMSLKTVPRCSEAFRSYKKSLITTKDRYDPYTNFFLDRSQQDEYVNEILPNKVRFSKNQAEKEYYQEILDKALLAQENQELSNINVGTHVHKNYDVSYNIDSLLRDDNNYEYDQDITNDSISDDRFLHQQRCQAESRLIKTTILSKLHKGESLTDLETTYLKAWRENIHGSMTPEHPSDIKISQLSKSDQDALNSLPLIDTSGLGDYAVNDLVLELDNFIDPVSVADIEHEIKVETLKVQWGLPHDFIVSEKRHKEADLVLGQVQENAYRYSAQFEKHEIQGLRDM